MEKLIGEPEGLGGWLILPAAGLFIMPIRSVISLINDFLPIFQEGYWEILTTPGSGAYHPLWAPLITFEIVGNVVFMLFSISLLFLFFTKSYRFPALITAYYALNLVFVLSDFFMSDLIPSVAAENNPRLFQSLLQTTAAAIIWISYFRISKRVKNTFVKQGPDKIKNV